MTKLTNTPAIYRIDGPGKFYVGSAVGISRRWIEHKRDLRRGDHANPILQAAWNCHGEAAHKGRKHGPMSEEQKAYYSKLYKGKKLSNEARERLSEARKGIVYTAERAAKISAALTGKTQSPETRAKLAAANLGKKALAETRAKISAAHAGKTLSAEHRKKLSVAAYRRYRSTQQEARANT